MLSHAMLRRDNTLSSLSTYSSQSARLGERAQAKLSTRAEMIEIFSLSLSPELPTPPTLSKPPGLPVPMIHKHGTSMMSPRPNLRRWMECYPSPSMLHQDTCLSSLLAQFLQSELFFLCHSCTVYNSSRGELKYRPVWRRVCRLLQLCSGPPRETPEGLAFGSGDTRSVTTGAGEGDA